MRKFLTICILVFGLSSCSSEVDAITAACEKALTIDRKIKYVKPVTQMLSLEHIDCPLIPFDDFYYRDGNCEVEGLDYTFLGTGRFTKKGDKKSPYLWDYKVEDFSAFETQIRKHNKLIRLNLADALDALRDSAKSNKDSRYLYDQIYDLRKVIKFERIMHNETEMNSDASPIAKKIRKVCSIYR